MAAARERKIMVAVDQSEESMYALSWCLDNLVSQDSTCRDTLILLYAKSPPRGVYSSPLDGTGTGFMFSSDTVDAIERHCNEVADSVVNNAKNMCAEHAQGHTEAVVAEGDARDVICDMAEKLKPDLLVMGSHGYGVIKRALLGSVSNHCAQNAKCPVLIVKKPKSTN